MYSIFPFSVPASVASLRRALAFATPKSMSFVVPRMEMRRFWGETSRCTTPSGRPVVAVQLVGRVETPARVGDDAERDAHREDVVGGSYVAIELPQRLAVDELHRVVDEPSVLADLEDARDVLVIDLRGDLRLVEEHVAELPVVRVGLQDRLESDEPFEPELAGHAREPNRTHAALREDAKQLVTVESVPRS